MNENNKKTLKGFTLIELIIVLAIFSGIMAGAISLVDPVSKIMTKASVTEKTNSYVNTIQDYVEGSVKYAENLNVYLLSADPDEEEKRVAEMVDNYRKTYFSNCVSKNPNGRHYFSKAEYVEHMLFVNEDSSVEELKTEEHWKDDYDNYVAYHSIAGILEPYIVLDDNDNKIATVKDRSNDITHTTGKIRVLCLDNVGNGNITLREVPFDSYTHITDANLPAAKNAINEAYFNAADSHYIFSYVLGATELMDVYEGIVFKSDYEEYDELDINSYNFSITVLTSKTTKGTIPQLTFGTDGAGNSISYTPFDKPAAATVINLPLININRRSGNIIQRPYCGMVDGTADLDADNNPVIKIRAQDAAKAFLIGTTLNLLPDPSDPDKDNSKLTGAIADPQKNIYFVYNYTDEIN